MRPQRIVGAIVLGLCLSGCQLTSDITHNVVFETCLCTSETTGKIYYRMLACSAYNEYLAGHPDCANSKDFAKGFKLGYADYLENGDCCTAHALPPLRYWKIHYETPEGRAATLAWLQGFREGAAAAKASGFRNFVIVPVGPSNAPADAAPPMPPPNAPPLGVGPVLPALPPTEELPVPNTLPTTPKTAPTPPSPPPSNDKTTTKPPASPMPGLEIGSTLPTPR
jgi:hypothetical protein